MNFYVDNNDDGSESFNWYNGTPSSVMTLDEIGDLDIIGALSSTAINLTGFSVDSDGDVIAKSLDVNSGGITEAGPISGATTISSSGAATLDSGGTGSSFGGALTLGGALNGPASFVIDPSTVGDDTGTVVIAGNLQVDGLTTTINSTTVSIDDLNFTIASGIATSELANGAGLSIDGAGMTFNWSHANTRMELNKGLSVTGMIWSSTYMQAGSGMYIGGGSSATLIDDASNAGNGSATLYIGDESILASGDIGSSVQAWDTQLDSLAGWTADQVTTLGTIATVTTSSNQIIYTTGADTFGQTALTAFGRSILDDFK